jgi:hypothetical protein
MKDLGSLGSASSKPVVRKRRRLPVIERPKSAPLTGEKVSKDQDNDEEEVMDVCDLSSNQAAMKTVIKVCQVS